MANEENITLMAIPDNPIIWDNALMTLRGYDMSIPQDRMYTETKSAGVVPPERESRIGEITNRVRNSNKTLYVLNEKLQNIIQNAEGPTPEVDSSASNKIEPCGSLGTLSMEVEVIQNLLCEIEQRIEYIERLL